MLTDVVQSRSLSESASASHHMTRVRHISTEINNVLNNFLKTTNKFTVD